MLHISYLWTATDIFHTRINERKLIIFPSVICHLQYASKEKSMVFFNSTQAYGIFSNSRALLILCSLNDKWETIGTWISLTAQHFWFHRCCRTDRCRKQLGERALHRRGRASGLSAGHCEEGVWALRLPPGLSAHPLTGRWHRLRHGYAANQ